MQDRVLMLPILSAAHMATVLAFHQHVSVTMVAMTEVIAALI